MPSKKSAPTLKVHKSTGQAYVILDGRRRYLGRADAPDAETRYRRAVAEWSAGLTVAPASDLTVVELVAAFWKHAETYYRGPDGTTTNELNSFRSAFRPLRELYGQTAAVEFGPMRFKAVRQCMVDLGWARSNINKMASRIKIVFRWGVAQELIPATVLHALDAVDGLRRGRCDARESAPVRPVPQDRINAVMPHVSRQVAAIIDLALLTAARSGELVIMRAVDIDTAGRIWIYKPTRHKTEHHGHDREIYLGPRAQRIVEPFFADRPVDAFLFSPAEAESERRERMHAERKTPLSCGNTPGSNLKRRPKREPGDRYTVDSYRRAIQYACDAAYPPPDELDTDERAAWRKDHRWHPHQLRHNAATQIKREHGLEAARVILGHRSPVITEHYAELDRGKAIDVMLRIG